MLAVPCATAMALASSGAMANAADSSTGKGPGNQVPCGADGSGPANWRAVQMRQWTRPIAESFGS